MTERLICTQSAKMKLFLGKLVQVSSNVKDRLRSAFPVRHTHMHTHREDDCHKFRVLFDIKIKYRQEISYTFGYKVS